MKTKRWLGVLIVASWLIGSSANAQQPGGPSAFPPPSPLLPNAASEKVDAPAYGDQSGLSDWIVYRRDCCEGAPGKQTPLYTEIYLQAGPSIPVGGMTLSRELKAGWSIMGGARALFFNEPMTRAWVVDLHIINTNESAGVNDTQFPITFFHNGIRSDLAVFQGQIGRQTFSLENSNRTMVGLGCGRDWYLRNPGDNDSCKWRVGVDGGARWGTHRISFNEFGHVTDVVGGLYVGAHSLIEIPYYSWILQGGFRAEWAYTWSDILQQPSDVQDLNFFVTVGLRF